MSKKNQTPDLLSHEYWNNTIKMSLSKFFILCVLHARPMHGYDVAKEVEEKTGGCCAPTEGTIYPVLKQFEAGGYATCESELVSGRERKVYTITDKGREAFQVALKAWMSITTCLEQCQSMADRCCEGGTGCCEIEPDTCGGHQGCC